jgi:hypothetical protein
MRYVIAWVGSAGTYIYSVRHCKECAEAEAATMDPSIVAYVEPWSED